MNAKSLKNLTSQTAKLMLNVGSLTTFDFMFRKYLLNEISWPVYASEDLISFRHRFGLTQDAIASLLGVSVKTVNGWESGTKNIPPTANIAFCVLEKLGAGIFDLMASKHSEMFTLRKLSDHDEKTTEDTNQLTSDLLSLTPIAPPVLFQRQDIIELRTALGLGRKAFADKLSVSLSTVDKWEQGNVVPHGPALKLLQQLWIKVRQN